MKTISLHRLRAACPTDTEWFQVPCIKKLGMCTSILSSSGSGDNWSHLVRSWSYKKTNRRSLTTSTLWVAPLSIPITPYRTAFSWEWKNEFRHTIKITWQNIQMPPGVDGNSTTVIFHQWVAHFWPVAINLKGRNEFSHLAQLSHWLHVLVLSAFLMQLQPCWPPTWLNSIPCELPHPFKLPHLGLLICSLLHSECPSSNDPFLHHCWNASFLVRPTLTTILEIESL